MSLRVPYYVGDQFSKEVTGVNLKNLEQAVEDDFISNLRNNCWKEKQQSMFAKKAIIGVYKPTMRYNISLCFGL